MSVNGVSALRSSIAFTGKAKTKEGNDYKKTKVGKIVGASVGAGLMGTLITLGGIAGGFKDMSKRAGILVASIAIALAIFGGIGLGLGAIVDAIINSSRRKKADRAEDAKMRGGVEA